MSNRMKMSGSCHCGDHVFTALTKGYVALVSVMDRDILLKNSWSSKVDKHSVYVQRSVGDFTRRLHREIMAPPKDKIVDHINGNGLDNRRENLRIANHAQNTANRIRCKKSKRGFVGVYPDRGRWKAMINTEKKSINLGRYKTAEEAARVRDKAAYDLYGEFARLNFPLPSAPSQEVAG